jgi:hypothetical protein
VGSDRHGTVVTNRYVPDPTSIAGSTVEKSTFARADQFLDGGDLLPGFSVNLSDLLDCGRRPRRG